MITMDPTGVSSGRTRTDPITTVVPGPSEYIPDSENYDQVSFPLTPPTSAGKLAQHQRNPPADHAQPVVGSSPMRKPVPSARHEKPISSGSVGSPDRSSEPEVPPSPKDLPQEAAADSCAAVPPDPAS